MRRRDAPSPLEDLHGEKVEHLVHDALEPSFEVVSRKCRKVIDPAPLDVFHGENTVRAELRKDSRDVHVVPERRGGGKLGDSLAGVFG